MDETGSAGPRAAEFGRIAADPRFHALVRQRNALGATLVLLTMVIYFGYVFLLAFAPGVMRTRVSGVITLGFPLALGVIVATILIVGVYVWRANTSFDRMRDAIVAGARR